jgi:hypothetical protein
MYEKLTMFLPILGETYGSWAEIHVKQPSMPFVVYETAARQLIDAIRDYVQQHIEYADYGQILQKAGIEWNYDSMSEADASILDGKTIVALLIGAVQAEKFCDGAFLGLLKQGCIIRWLGKLEVIDNRKTVEYYPGLFDEFKVQKILDRWDKFPGIMWGLGFELDYYHSFELYRKRSNLKLKPSHSKREERRNLLYLLEHADRQIVGNFLFSEWRKYVKCELSYDQFDLDFIFRVMDILESRYI